jgi:hypothetical protein
MSAGPHDTVGPDAGVAREDRRLAETLAEIVEDLPVVDEDLLEERHGGMWSDEAGSLGYAHRQYRPDHHDLPGFGEGQPDCGVEIPHICEGCGHVIEVGRTCSQSMCRRCAPAWVLDRAPGIINRIYSAAKMKEGSQKLHHVAVSPPRDLLLDTDDDQDWYDACFDALHQWMDEIDMDGIVLAHPWSGDTSDGLGSQHQDDRGEWQKRLFEGRDWEGDVREELQHRPHFHVIGCAEWFPGGDVTRLLHERTGWVTHRITKHNSNRSLDGLHDLARAVTYALSHVAIDTSGDRNRYRRKKVGSAYHGADDRHLRKAKEAAHDVAPDTLGIPEMRVECQKELPEEECDHDDEHTTPSTDDGDAGVEETEPESSTTQAMEKCRRSPVDVDDADFVDDPDWRQSALFAEDAVDAREEWQEAGGWQGWSGQETLEDDPPPD